MISSRMEEGVAFTERVEAAGGKPALEIPPGHWVGTCLCDHCAVTIPELSPADNKQFACHCRSCQKFSGSSQVSAIFLPKDKVTLSGPFKTFIDKSDLGNTVTRYFCPGCGSSMASTTTLAPDTIAVFSGAFAQVRDFPYFLEMVTRSRFAHAPPLEGTAQVHHTDVAAALNSGN